MVAEEVPVVAPHLSIRLARCKWVGVKRSREQPPGRLPRLLKCDRRLTPARPNPTTGQPWRKREGGPIERSTVVRQLPPRACTPPFPLTRRLSPSNQTRPTAQPNWHRPRPHTWNVWGYAVGVDRGRSRAGLWARFWSPIVSAAKKSNRRRSGGTSGWAACSERSARSAPWLSTVFGLSHDERWRTVGQR
jgi:hypothetical protein